jgi:hypothetical protein
MSKRKLTALNKRYCEPDLSKHICSICHEEYVGCGNNAWPVNDGRCCGYCNGSVVIPTRYSRMRERWAAEAAKH